MKDEALSPAAFVMETIRVTTGTTEQAPAIGEAVQPLLDLTRQLHSWEGETVKLACEEFALPSPDDRLIDWLALSTDTFLGRVTRLTESGRLSSGEIDRLAKFQQQARTRQVDLLRQQLDLEKRLALLVEDAYGLTAEERALLRATRPVRDPIDVLERKIRGKTDSQERDSSD
jgi:hypothetical protein